MEKIVKNFLEDLLIKEPDIQKSFIENTNDKIGVKKAPVIDITSKSHASSSSSSTSSSGDYLSDIDLEGFRFSELVTFFLSNFVLSNFGMNLYMEMNSSKTPTGYIKSLILDTSVICKSYRFAFMYKFFTRERSDRDVKEQWFYDPYKFIKKSFDLEHLELIFSHIKNETHNFGFYLDSTLGYVNDILEFIKNNSNLGNSEEKRKVIDYINTQNIKGLSEELKGYKKGLYYNYDGDDKYTISLDFLLLFVSIQYYTNLVTKKLVTSRDLCKIIFSSASVIFFPNIPVSDDIYEKGNQNSVFKSISMENEKNEKVNVNINIERNNWLRGAWSLFISMIYEYEKKRDNPCSEDQKKIGNNPHLIYIKTKVMIDDILNDIAKSISESHTSTGSNDGDYNDDDDDDDIIIEAKPKDILSKALLACLSYKCWLVVRRYEIENNEQKTLDLLYYKSFKHNSTESFPNIRDPQKFIFWWPTHRGSIDKQSLPLSTLKGNVIKTKNNSSFYESFKKDMKLIYEESKHLHSFRESRVALAPLPLHLVREYDSQDIGCVDLSKIDKHFDQLQRSMKQTSRLIAEIEAFKSDGRFNMPQQRQDLKDEKRSKTSSSSSTDKKHKKSSEGSDGKYIIPGLIEKLKKSIINLRMITNITNESIYEDKKSINRVIKKKIIRDEKKKKDNEKRKHKDIDESVSKDRIIDYDPFIFTCELSFGERYEKNLSIDGKEITGINERNMDTNFKYCTETTKYVSENNGSGKFFNNVSIGHCTTSDEKFDSVLVTKHNKNQRNFRTIRYFSDGNKIKENVFSTLESKKDWSGAENGGDINNSKTKNKKHFDNKNLNKNNKRNKKQQQKLKSKSSSQTSSSNYNNSKKFTTNNFDDITYFKQGKDVNFRIDLMEMYVIQSKAIINRAEQMIKINGIEKQ